MGDIHYMFSKADYKSFAAMDEQVLEDIQLIGKSLLRLSRNLKAIRDRGLYLCGSYRTFDEYCRARLGKGRQYIYRLIQSHDVLQHLLEDGVVQEDLPSTERLVREIRQLEEKDQAPVWKAVMRAKKGTGQAPTIHDVQAEAAKLTPSDKTIDRQQDELIKRIEGAGRALTVNVDFKVLTPYYRRRLLAVFQDIADKLQVLMSAFSSASIDAVVPAETKNEEEPEPWYIMDDEGTASGYSATQDPPDEVDDTPMNRAYATEAEAEAAIALLPSREIAE
jgi:hypothetical protein